MITISKDKQRLWRRGDPAYNPGLLRSDESTPRKDFAVDDERALIERANRLEQDALSSIHDQYYQPIYRYISYRVDDVHSVEDLTSEVFTRFLAALRNRKGPQDTLRGWFYGTAANVVKEHYRDKRRRDHELLDETAPSPDHGPDESLDRKIANRQLREALSGLTDEQQQVLALRYGMDLPFRDVAEMMNKSEGSVKMLQTRAIAALTRKLTGSEGRS